MLDFCASQPLTLGVELELMIVNRHDYNLTRGSDDLLRLIGREDHGFDIKPEITQGMIEIGTAIHTRTRAMLEELDAIRAVLVRAADTLNLGLAGGGAHPFQHWSEQRIYPKERYLLVSELYGYLAQQFTVYGQHIHIGCPDGDQAIRLAHFLARYIPHFIALSAASPYYQGVDTLFQSSRLTSVNAFPLSGTLPCVTDWAGFNDYFVRMQQLGIVASMKDFYWDVRPKPEYGTVEIRVCDTPLDLLTPVLLAAYAQMLARECMESGWQAIHSDNYLAYSYNRFQACRFGFEGLILNPADNGQVSLQQDLVTTLTRLEPQAAALGCEAERQQLLARALARDNPSRQLRTLYERSGSLNDLVRRQSAVWMRDAATL
ncbi:YbdK family carboxylate-amine ligase [Laribacter hongkongensis]|uniref:Putative glutamate--cysteine ligase 2 n=1 Tax=Laribacter hongkongensis (strain HLHK9) TaxID=557598 RepID=GCS2_LARHH|nr:YbdK family carboxylate-amine ligase [Laribacter hongkongensis]C1DD64.1 RecName: Full=Putative glutamate--cysteine ligase 2; AltName: Full=Gamma-glutamylcysteine synthetase 2; Short=GCS 2; Short=Gamma-GCS 2 [Laribacter hongkongensis HLHK9]ACO73699.1 YbdK [Laribacter hongkongensis HLHK9]MCG8991989.1 glutamate--cysteine ligase [Laribacter hongkongensis]MCG8997882.1 glutamate--cysteine ligase [Laribacter hongkongensis]MCG9000977.1 glutamate--cysteine ligase [Laribacter hongkongensis]MCG900297